MVRVLTPELRAAAERALRSTFLKYYEAADAGPWGDLFSVEPSNSAGNNYPLAGAAPTMSEWTGTRVIDGIREDAFYVLNKKYQAAIEVDDADLERDNLGIYNNAIAEMAINAKRYMVDLFETILANGTTITRSRCWDGAALFSASHGKDDGASQSNIVSGSGVDTVAHVQADLQAAVGKFATWKNDKGETTPIYAPKLTIIYPVTNNALALLLDTIALGRQSLGEADLSRYIGAMIPCADITGNDWYTAAGGGMIRPFGWQEEKAPTPSTNYVWGRGVTQMGVDARGAAFSADWRRIVMINNS